MLSRYKTKLDDSQISNLMIDRVYYLYVHFEKFKGKHTYIDTTNLYLPIAHFFHAYIFTIIIPH